MPGGTASNIVAYIAKGDMPLSIMMTTASTLMAVFTTPLLTSLLVGTLVPVDAKAMFVSVLQLVLAPVIVGTALNQYFPRVGGPANTTSCRVELLLLPCCSGTMKQQQQLLLTLPASMQGMSLVHCVVTCGTGCGPHGCLPPQPSAVYQPHPIPKASHPPTPTSSALPPEPHISLLCVLSSCRLFNGCASTLPSWPRCLLF